MSEPAAVAPSWHAASEREVPDHDDWLAQPEAARLAAMAYTKRRLESRLGRWTAKQAIARFMGLPGSVDDLRRLRIVNAPDGAPEAFVGDRPAGVSISMTDRAGWAVCVVSSTASGIGCDLEVVEPRSDAFVVDYFTPAEQALVAGWDDRDLVANLVWSAKESALKVLRTGLRRDTRSVEVTLDGTGTGWRSLQIAADGEVIDGWWRRFGSFVLTMAARDSLAMPVSQTAPSPLERAEPIHSWLAQPLTGAGGTDVVRARDASQDAPRDGARRP